MKFPEKDSPGPLCESEAESHTSLIFTDTQMIVLMYFNVCLPDGKAVSALRGFCFS